MSELQQATGETLDAHDQLDDALSCLDRALRAGDEGETRLHLAMFDAGFEEYVRGEETIVFPVIERISASRAAPTTRMRREHVGMRTLLAALRDAVESANAAVGLRVLGTLRSVYLLHMAKEEWVLRGLLDGRATR